MKQIIRKLNLKKILSIVTTIEKNSFEVKLSNEFFNYFKFNLIPTMPYNMHYLVIILA